MTEADIKKAMRKAVIDIVREEANKVKQELVRVTKESFDEYYEFPEGKYYRRTDQFHKAYSVFDQGYYGNNIDKIHATVGIVFDVVPQYRYHGISEEEIYDRNLSGLHGPRQGSSPYNIIKSAADMMVALMDA